MWHCCRKCVSGNKTRYEKDGYDLDLTYLQPRIIVHGFPSIGIEHMYRNPRYEIRRFLDEKHADHYKMFNFCCEPGRGYDASVYHDRVERYPFKDHNTPPLETMVAFAESCKLWLDSDPLNVCSMHCKAGKGRAGLMSCVLMIRSGACQSALEALDHYDLTRVTNKRGLTVNSQRKYVIFYEKLWRDHWGISGDIGKIKGETPNSNRWVVPDQPELRLFGVEILNSGMPIRHLRVKVFKGTYLTPMQVYDTGAGTNAASTSSSVLSCECDCPIQGKEIDFGQKLTHTTPRTGTLKIA